MAKLRYTIKSCFDKTTIVDQLSPFHLPELEQPYYFEKTIQEKKSIIKEPAASSTFSNSCAVELNACLSSHLPMKYQLIPCQVSIPNYSRIPPMVGIDDPRLRHSIIAAKDPMLIQNAPLTVSAVNVRPNDPRWKPMADRDPRQWHRFNMDQRKNYINYF